MATPASPSRPRMAHTLRVNQLDAQQLDAEISSLLRQQLADAFLWQTSVLDRLQPELDAILQAVLWRYSIWIGEPTPGGHLQNVRYARADGGAVSPKPMHRWQKFAFLAVNVILPWLAVRGRGLAQALEDDSGDVAAGSARGVLRRWAGALARWCLRSAEPRVGALHAVCAAANFLIFLRHGTFTNLSDRLLNVRMVHVDPHARRQVMFEYMNRVMIWNGVSEFLLTVMPLVNLAGVRKALARRFVPKALLRSMEVSAESGCCCLCGAAPVTLPMRSDCGHVFCYFCITSEQMDHPGNVVCPHCSAKIQSVQHAQ
mmetsp:Transcript_140398/g.436545  ORF Transcript_140398/g.436545 Transcript_140398/m.436545 type:complete len:315 (+) Transcript_140398:59-1003(+)